MASYLEVKQLLRDILCIDIDINENCDIPVPVSSNLEEGTNIIFPNEPLKDAFNTMQNFAKDKLELSTETYREVALRFFGPVQRIIVESVPINDSVNELTYTIGHASLEYCMFLLNAIVESVRIYGRRIYIDLKHRSRMIIRRNTSSDDVNNPLELLPEILRAYTLKINSTKSIPLLRIRDYAASFEFQYMYKQSAAVSEYTDVQDMYLIGNPMLRYSRESIDSPPQRIYNVAVLDYYAMAMESRDPFTMYISFYHVIEYYFDAVFKKKLTKEIKDRITHPDFSYKSEEKLYELAKYVRKHMSSDYDSGKGNEFESLKFVLMEYVSVDELKKRINYLDSNAIDYYQKNLVPFTTSKKTKIVWSDTQGVYTNLATRIYETRNALVHSKSDQIANRYRPYENKKDLLSEIALIRSIAELVLINSSEIL